MHKAEFLPTPFLICFCLEQKKQRQRPTSGKSASEMQIAPIGCDMKPESLEVNEGHAQCL